MYCPRCGTENADSAAFCQSCGQSLGAATAPEAGPTESGPAQTGQPTYQQTYQPPAPGSVPRIPSYLGWAIISIFLFWPTGIAAVVYASRVDNLLTLGNVAGAQEASGKAKLFATISTVAFVIWLIIVIAVAACAGPVRHFYG